MDGQTDLPKEGHGGCKMFMGLLTIKVWTRALRTSASGCQAPSMVLEGLGEDVNQVHQAEPPTVLSVDALDAL